MLIAQVSDTHLTVDTPDADRRADDLRRTIADINALDPLPDVIVHTGDIVHNGLFEEYELAARLLSKALPPIYLIVGNKDNRKVLHRAFSFQDYLQSNKPFVTYAVDDFPVRMIMLDTLDPQSNKGDFCAERAALLDGFLETEKSVAVFAHHPPFEVTVGPEPWNFNTDEAMNRLRDRLTASDQIAGVFCGHVHRSTMGLIGEIPVKVIPSVATPLRWGEYPETMQVRPTYFLHQYDPAQGFSTLTRIV